MSVTNSRNTWKFFLNSGISAVFGDKIVLHENNTEDVKYKFYIYLTVTKQNEFFLTSSIAG